MNYKEMVWQQGRLLKTRQTEQWSDEKRNKSDYEERCCAFVNFSSQDQGRGRRFVKKFDTPEECAVAIKKNITMK